MRFKSIVFILSLFGFCFAGEWIDAYFDNNGKYHPAHYQSSYTPAPAPATTKAYKPYHDDSYKPKTEYVRPYVKRDGKFVKGYWRSEKDQ